MTVSLVAVLYRLLQEKLFLKEEKICYKMVHYTFRFIQSSEIALES